MYCKIFSDTTSTCIIVYMCTNHSFEMRFCALFCAGRSDFITSSAADRRKNVPCVDAITMFATAAAAAAADQECFAFIGIKSRNQFARINSSRSLFAPNGNLLMFAIAAFQ